MYRPQGFRVLGLALLILAPAHAAEKDALAIESNILARHLPFGTILNPILTADHAGIAGYTRCGDSALFTGLYLAAESFRYKATGDRQAIRNVQTAVAGLRLLVDVTGRDLLARCAVPADSPYAAGIAAEEAHNGVYSATVGGRAWKFVANTSRDQYTGVFFGLATAYDMVSDATLRAGIASLVTRLLDNLFRNGWNVVMPDNSVSTTFTIRPDQQLAFLQIGRHVNPQAYASQYANMSSLASLAVVPLGVDAANDHDSYFKFNLDFLNLFSLLRLEESNSSARTWYERGFATVRATTANHLNAEFNMIDRALHGPDAAREAETRADLIAWLQRPRTDLYVDLHGKVPVCASDLACNPVPVAMRPPSDFLWQLDPFQLSGGGSGIVETAGIDYTLPYWMARVYGVVPKPLTSPHLYDGVLRHGVRGI